MFSRLFLLRSCNLSSFKFHRMPVILKSFHSNSSKKLLQSSAPAKTHIRAFWETFPSVRPLYYEKDGVDKDKYTLVYHAQIFNYAFWAQLGTFSLIGGEIFGGLKYLYKLFFSPEVADAMNYVGPYTLNVASLSGILALIFFNTQGLIMIFAAQTSVLRVYFCEKTEEFVFVKLGLNPFKSRLLYCKKGELHQLEESPVNFLFGNHKLNNERLYIMTQNFKSNYLYNSLLFKDYK